MFVDTENLLQIKQQWIEQLETVEHELFIDEVSNNCYLDDSEKEDFLNRKQMILQQLEEINNKIKEKENENKKLDKLV